MSTDQVIAVSADAPKQSRAKGDPRDDDFIVKYEKSNFQKGEGEGGIAELY